MKAVNAALVLAVLLYGVSFAAETQQEQENEAGRATFKKGCVACHGADGAGTPVGKSLQAPDLRSPEVQKKSDTELTQTVIDGRRNMPPFKTSLNPDQIQAVIKYVRELGKSTTPSH